MKTIWKYNNCFRIIPKTIFSLHCLEKLLHRQQKFFNPYINSIFQTLENEFQTMENEFQSLENKFQGLESTFLSGAKYFSLRIDVFLYQELLFFGRNKVLKKGGWRLGNLSMHLGAFWCIWRLIIGEIHVKYWVKTEC